MGSVTCVCGRCGVRCVVNCVRKVAQVGNSVCPGPQSAVPQLGPAQHLWLRGLTSLPLVNLASIMWNEHSLNHEASVILCTASVWYRNKRDVHPLCFWPSLCFWPPGMTLPIRLFLLLFFNVVLFRLAQCTTLENVVSPRVTLSRSRSTSVDFLSISAQTFHGPSPMLAVMLDA